MAVNLKCTEKSLGIRKYSFFRKPFHSDGLLVQVHHTAVGSRHPVRFLHFAFHSSEDILAVTDAKGSIFIIDLTQNKFWSLPNDSKCTAIAFSSYNRNELIAASSDCNVKIINFENGKESSCLKGHLIPPTQLSCGGDGGKMLLSSAACSCQNNTQHKASSVQKQRAIGEAILWDMSTHTQAHCLNIQSDLGIIQATFLPGVSSNCILAIFEDDTMCIWKLEEFECVKLLLPPISRQSKNHHHMKTIACTRNGRAMVVGGKSHSLVAYSLNTWEAVKVIELPNEICGLKILEFLPQPFDGGSNHILGILSYDGHAHFLDLNSSTFIGDFGSERSRFCNFVCSSSGCYIACILQSGEMNIYCGSLILTGEIPLKLKVIDGKKAEIVVNRGQRITHHEKHSSLSECDKIYDATYKRNTAVLKKNATKVKEQIKSELNHKRLRSLLRYHGAFPSRYRIVAWRIALLQLPYNQKAFSDLIARGIHPAYAHIEQKYPLENQIELKQLKKLMSCLAHWSPLFSQVNYLPLFIYPFAKLFIHDMLGCFEAVATIIINYCQHWFEFFPFPPINVLAAIENLLSHHDPSLLEFFVKNGVDTRMYAWPLLQVALSEVLSNEEWLGFWDHILVNEPSFLLAAIPAYCIVCRTALLRCRTMDDFEFFFRNQNPVDMEKFISKTYWICQNTPPEFHPRQHLNEFQPLPRGETYPTFSQYPKILVDANAEKLKRIQMDEEAMISQELEMLKLIQKREEQKMVAENAVLKQKYLKELEKAYQYAWKIEEDKLSRHYMELLSLKNNIHNNNLGGKIERLGSEEEKENSPTCTDRRPLLSQKQEGNKEDEGIPSSSKRISESPKESLLHHFCTRRPLTNQLPYGRKQQFRPMEGDEPLPVNTALINGGEEISFDIAKNKELQNETLEECHGYFTMGNKHQILQHKPKLQEVNRNDCILLTESLESLECGRARDLNFSKKSEKKRWEISRNNSQDQLQKHLDGVIFKRSGDIYHKEKEAMQQALEARMKVVCGRITSSAFQTSL